MWGDIDFSKLNISFDLEDVHITILNAKRNAIFGSFPNHMHSFYELHYNVEGEGFLICRNERLPLHDNILYLNGPGVYHEQESLPGRAMVEYSLSFDVQPIGSKKSSLTGKLKNMELWIGSDSCGIGEIFAQIEAEITNKHTGYYQAVCTLIRLLIIRLIRNFDNQGKEPADTHRTTGDRRKFIMDEAFIYNYRSMTLESLAKMLNLSERQTIRNIHEYYSMNFTEFRNNSRMTAAAQLLREQPDMSIPDIAEAVGFSSPTHFRNLFKKYHGMTPSEYRQSADDGGKSRSAK